MNRDDINEIYLSPDQIKAEVNNWKEDKKDLEQQANILINTAIDQFTKGRLKDTLLKRVLELYCPVIGKDPNKSFTYIKQKTNNYEKKEQVSNDTKKT